MAVYDESRLRKMDRDRIQVVGPSGRYLDRCFCVSCGKDMGAVTPNAFDVVMSCDDCARYGSIECPPLPEAPASVPRCKSCGATGSDVGPPGTFYVCDSCCEKNGDPPGAIRAEHAKAMRIATGG